MFALVCATVVSAQPYVREWVQTVNGSGNGNDYVTDVAVDAQDNIYVFGNTTVSGGETDFILVKYNPSGGVIWSRIYAKLGPDTSGQMVLDSAGNIYLSGTSNGQTKSWEFFTIKYTPSGDLVWAKSFNLRPDLAVYEQPRGIAVDSLGRVFVCGTASNGTSQDFVVVGYDADGVEKWHATADGNGHVEDGANAIMVGADGYVYACGMLTESPGITSIGIGRYHPVTGVASWFVQEQAPYGGSALATAIANDSTGNLYVYGQTGLQGGGYSMYLMRAAAASGQRLNPDVSVPDNGVLNLGSPQAIDAGRMSVFQDVAFVTGRGNISDERYFVTARMFFNGTSSEVTKSQPKGNYAGAGDVVADRHAAGHFVGTVGVLNQGYNMVIKRHAGAEGGGTVEYNGPANKTDFAWGVAVDSKEDVIVVGHSEMANGTYDLVVLKYDQKPFAMGDRIHAYQDKTLSVNAASGLLANDLGSVGATAVKMGGPANGTLTVNGDGSYTYVPKPGFVGGDQILYRADKTGNPGQANYSAIYTHPGILSVTIIPAEMIGGEKATAKITLKAAEPNEPTAGTVEATPMSLVQYIPSTWAPGPGETYSSFFFTTQSVASSQNLTIKASRGGYTASATVVVKPGGILSVSLSPSSFVGGDEPVAKVTIGAPAPAGGTQILLSSPSSNILPPASVTIPAGQTFTSVGIPTKVVANAETAVVQATHGFASRQTTVTIRPKPKLASLTVSPNSVHGGSPTTATVTLDSKANLGGTTVNMSDNSGSITTPPQTIVPQETTSKAVEIGTLQVGASATRQITATLGTVTKTSNLTLIPSPSLVSLTLSPNTVFGGQATTGTVTLSAAPTLDSGVMVALSENTSAIDTPSSAVVSKAASSKSFSIYTSPVGATATRTVSAALNGVSRSASLTLKPGPALSALSVSPSTVKGGQGSTGTVTLSASAPATITVSLTDNSSAISEPSTVNVSTGNTQATFPITTLAVTSSATRTITATLGSTSKTVGLTLTP